MERNRPTSADRHLAPFLLRRHREYLLVYICSCSFRLRPLMHVLDIAVIGLYFALIAYIGYRTGRGNKGIEDFFLAKRAMPWYVIGLSVMATQASAITLIGTTGQAYVDGMRFIQFYFGLRSRW
jgi:hypothetical protein